MEVTNLNTSVQVLDKNFCNRDGNPLPVAIEVSGCINGEEKTLLKVKAEIMYTKLYGKHAVRILDSYSAAWGEVGWQMFGKEDPITGMPRYVLDNVMLFDFEESYPTLEDRSLFDAAFPMDEMVRSILRACDQLIKKNKVPHFVFFGNERVCSGDGKWLHKFMGSGFLVFRTADSLTAREDCFMAVLTKGE